jgi:hypothetical protein
MAGSGSEALRWTVTSGRSIDRFQMCRSLSLYIYTSLE